LGPTERDAAKNPILIPKTLANSPMVLARIFSPSENHRSAMKGGA